MIIYFLRHASAGEPMSSPKKDERRALDETGIEQCRQIGRTLAAMEVQLVGNEMGHEGKLQLDAALRPEASFSQFRELVGRYPSADAIMVVGHNPNLSEFVGRLITRGSGTAIVDLKKGAVARVETKRNAAALQWCLTPKLATVLQATSVESSRPKTPRK
jgi:phosphohistidine phosphatase